MIKRLGALAIFLLFFSQQNQYGSSDSLGPDMLRPKRLSSQILLNAFLTGKISECFYQSGYYAQKLKERGCLVSENEVNQKLNSLKREILVYKPEQTFVISNAWDEDLKKDQAGFDSDLFKELLQFFEQQKKESLALEMLKNEDVENFFKNSIQKILQSYGISFDDMIYDLIFNSAQEVYGRDIVWQKMRSNYVRIVEMLQANPEKTIVDLVRGNVLDAHSFFAQMVGRSGVCMHVKQLSNIKDNDVFFTLFNIVSQEEEPSCVNWYQELVCGSEYLQCLLRIKIFEKWTKDYKQDDEVLKESQDYQQLITAIEDKKNIMQDSSENEWILNIICNGLNACYRGGDSINRNLMALALEIFLHNQPAGVKTRLMKDCNNFKQLKPINTVSGTSIGVRTYLQVYQNKNLKKGTFVSAESLFAKSTPCIAQLLKICDHCKYLYDKFVTIYSLDPKKDQELIYCFIRYIDSTQNIQSNVLKIEDDNQFVCQIESVFENFVMQMPKNMHMHVGALRAAKIERLKLQELEILKQQQEQEELRKQKLETVRLQKQKQRSALMLEKKLSTEHAHSRFCDWLQYHRLHKEQFYNQVILSNQQHANMVEQARLNRLLLPQLQELENINCSEQIKDDIVHVEKVPLTSAKNAEQKEMVRQAKIARRIQRKDVNSNIVVQSAKLNFLKKISIIADGLKSKHHKYSTSLHTYIADSNAIIQKQEENDRCYKEYENGMSGLQRMITFLHQQQSDQDACLQDFKSMAETDLIKLEDRIQTLVSPKAWRNYPYGLYSAWVGNQKAAIEHVRWLSSNH